MFDCFELPSYTSTDLTVATNQKIEATGPAENNSFASLEILYVMATVNIWTKNKNGQTENMAAVNESCL